MNRPQMIENLKQDVQRLIDEGYKTPTVSNHGIADLITRIEELEATLKRVRDLHPPRPNSMSALYPTPLCACGKNYPCPTTQALEGEPNE